MHRLKRFSTHGDYATYVSQEEKFSNPQKFIGYCRREKEVHFYTPAETQPGLYFWWSGKGWISGSGTGDTSATYYRTSIRVKDIKIYTHLENYET